MQYIKAFQKSQSAFTKFYLLSKFLQNYNFILKMYNEDILLLLSAPKRLIT